jgi:hypothetical protein
MVLKFSTSLSCIVLPFLTIVGRGGIITRRWRGGDGRPILARRFFNCFSIFPLVFSFFPREKNKRKKFLKGKRHKKNFSKKFSFMKNDTTQFCFLNVFFLFFFEKKTKRKNLYKKT